MRELLQLDEMEGWRMGLARDHLTLMLRAAGHQYNISDISVASSAISDDRHYAMLTGMSPT